MALLEKQVENKLIVACKRNGIITYKGNPKGNIGFPDRIVFDIKRHRTFFVEIKNDTYYSQTDMQKLWQNYIETSGNKYILINGMEEMKQFIEKYIETKKVQADTRLAEEFKNFVEKNIGDSK